MATLVALLGADIARLAWRFRRVAEIALGVLLLSTNLSFADPATIHLSQALPIITSHEEGIRVVEWTSLARLGWTSNPETASDIKYEPTYYRAHVVFEPRSRRHRMDVDYVTKWTDGKARYVACRDQSVFDGAQFVYLNTQRWGTDLPEDGDIPGRAEVYAEGQRRDSFTSGSMAFGWGLLPPFFWEGNRLSALMKEAADSGHAPTIADIGGKSWEVSLRDKRLPHGIMSVAFDTEKGLVTRVEWLEAGKPWQRLLVDAQRLANGFWVPSSVKLVTIVNKHVQHLQVSDIKINHSVDDKVFELAIPAGVRVTDYINSQSYISSTGIKDDEAALRRFMQAHGLTGPEPQRSQSLAWLWVPCIVLVVLVPAAWWWFRSRSRRKHAASACILIVATSASTLLHAGERKDANRTDAAAKDTGPMLTMTYGDGKRIPVRQCGHLVSLFALEYFGRTYNAEHVAASLPAAASEGVKLGDIRVALEGHGLEATARQDLSTKDLHRSVTPQLLVILPVRLPSGRNHYLVVTRHSDQGPIGVDVLQRVAPLSDMINDELLKQTHAVGLFVRRPRNAGKDGESLNRRVRVEPERIEAGTFKEGDPEASKPRVHEFKITNPTEDPVFVSRVTSSCGCISVDKWTGGLLEPGASRVLFFNIVPTSWGTTSTKVITLGFPDGSELPVEVHGRLLAAEQVHELRVAPNVLRIDLAAIARDQTTAERTATIYLGNKRASPLRHSGSPPWLNVTIQPAKEEAPEEEAALGITVQIDEKLRERVADDKQVLGEVFVASQPEDKGVRLQVILFQSEFFDVGGAPLQLSRGDKKAHSISVTPIPGRARSLSPLRAWADGAGLTFKTTKQDDGSVRIEVAAGEATARGYHLAKCSLECDTGAKSVCSFVVRVKE